MGFADRLAIATRAAGNAAVRIAGFVILFIAACFAFLVATAVPAVFINMIVYGIADAIWNLPVSEEVTMSLLGFILAVVFATFWAARLKAKLHAEYTWVAGYIVIAAATSAIYVMVAFQAVINLHEFLPPQFSDNMGSNGSLVDQLVFFVDNLLHVVLLDLLSIFDWRVSDIAPVTTLGRWLVFLTRLVMTISFAAAVSMILRTAHLRLDQPISAAR